MYSKYFPEYKADIFTSNIRVHFSRLYNDITDPMSDSPQREWEPKDEFIIRIHKISKEVNTREYTSLDRSIVGKDSCRYRVVESYEITVHRKLAANVIWKIAKTSDNYDNVVAVAEYIKKDEEK